MEFNLERPETQLLHYFLFFYCFFKSHHLKTRTVTGAENLRPEDDTVKAQRDHFPASWGAEVVIPEVAISDLERDKLIAKFCWRWNCPSGYCLFYPGDRNILPTTLLSLKRVGYEFVCKIEANEFRTVEPNSHHTTSFLWESTYRKSGHRNDNPSTKGDQNGFFLCRTSPR